MTPAAADDGARRSRSRRIWLAVSRLLSALTDGQELATFSAWSHELARRGSWRGRARVAVVDWLNRDPLHCQDAWQWHVARGLIVPRPAADGADAAGA